MWKTTPPQKDYYAVIFSSTKSSDLEGYQEMDDLMMKLAQEQEGFLGYESTSHENSGIFISYWQSLEATNLWRHNIGHIQAKANAKLWYNRYLSQICKVESSHLFEV